MSKIMNREYVNGLVSIITPMYNAQNHIEQTITSVLEQTYQNWEMIIVDDVSTDNSVAIVERYTQVNDERYDERIHLYRNDRNQGVALTRNNAMQYARGRYIAFLDSDDLWKPNKLFLQLETMKMNEAGFCYASCEVIDEEGNISAANRIVPSKMEYKTLLKGNQIPCLTVIIDRNEIQEIYFPNIKHEDYAAWLSIFCKEEVRAVGVQEVIASYRISKDSITASKKKSAVWTWNIYRKHLKLSFFKSVYCFLWYVFYAIKKRM